MKYAYESTSRRIPGRKNPVTDKVYLGKVDPETGRIIPKEPRVKPEEEHVLRYGAVTVLDGVQDGIGLLSDLEESFPDIANKVMGAAMAQVIEPTCFDDLHFVVEDSIIGDALRLRGNLSPAVMSDLSKDLGQRYGAMDGFFRSRLARSADGGPYALDLTSVGLLPLRHGRLVRVGPQPRRRAAEADGDHAGDRWEGDTCRIPDAPRLHRGLVRPREHRGLAGRAGMRCQTRDGQGFLERPQHRGAAGDGRRIHRPFQHPRGADQEAPHPCGGRSQGIRILPQP